MINEFVFTKDLDELFEYLLVHSGSMTRLTCH